MCCAIRPIGTARTPRAARYRRHHPVAAHRRDLPNRLIGLVSHEHIARAIHRHANRAVKLRCAVRPIGTARTPRTARNRRHHPVAARRCDLPNRVIKLIRYKDVTGAIHRHAVGPVKPGRAAHAIIGASRTHETGQSGERVGRIVPKRRRERHVRNWHRDRTHPVRVAVIPNAKRPTVRRRRGNQHVGAHRINPAAGHRPALHRSRQDRDSHRWNTVGNDQVGLCVGRFAGWAADDQCDRVGAHSVIGVPAAGPENIRGRPIPKVPKPVGNRAGRSIGKSHKERGRAVRRNRTELRHRSRGDGAIINETTGELHTAAGHIDEAVIHDQSGTGERGSVRDTHGAIVGHNPSQCQLSAGTICAERSLVDQRAADGATAGQHRVTADGQTISKRVQATLELINGRTRSIPDNERLAGGDGRAFGGQLPAAESQDAQRSIRPEELIHREEPVA